MPTIKNALELISKLSKTDQISLKHILLRAATTAASVDDFLTNKKIPNGSTCIACGKTQLFLVRIKNLSLGRNISNA